MSSRGSGIFKKNLDIPVETPIRWAAWHRDVAYGLESWWVRGRKHPTLCTRIGSKRYGDWTGAEILRPYLIDKKALAGRP